MKAALPFVTVVLVTVFAAAPCNAAWISDPNTNTPIVTKPNDQVQPKWAPLPDGGCWISWLDNVAGGYDTYVQWLDRTGRLMLPPGGVLVVNTSFSSTEDYGFGVDPETGIAWVAFRDDRMGGIVITVNAITPNGTLVFGPAGITLANSSGGAAPRLAVTPTGVVVGWSTDEGFRLQKLDAAGMPLWPNGVVQIAPSGSFDLMADLKASDDGSVIVSWVRYMARALYAQKYSVTGTPLWNLGSPRAIFTSGALQFGNFPELTRDGAGGAVFSWYDTLGVRNAYVQRINSAGTPVLAVNGVAVNTTSNRIRLEPAHTYNPDTNEIFVFWVESNSVQSQWGVYGQKITAAGARAWGNAGVVLSPLDSTQEAFLCAERFLDGVIAFWMVNPNNTRILGTRLANGGTAIWSQAEIARRATTKGRLESDQTPSGMPLLAWEDGATGNTDIYATTVIPVTGKVGLPVFLHGDLDCDADIDFFDIDPLVSALEGQAAYQALYPNCYWLSGDCDDDGDVDLFDIDPFVALLGT